MISVKHTRIITICCCIGILALHPGPDGQLFALLANEPAGSCELQFNASAGYTVRFPGPSSSHATQRECRKYSGSGEHSRLQGDCTATAKLPRPRLSRLAPQERDSVARRFHGHARLPVFKSRFSALTASGFEVG